MLILNADSKTFHDKDALTESCNTDDIASSARSEDEEDAIPRLIEEGWRACRHCLPDKDA